MGELRFCVVFQMWSYISLILLCQATLANDGNHADITLKPHIAHFVLNTRCSILPPRPICPDLLYPFNAVEDISCPESARCFAGCKIPYRQCQSVLRMGHGRVVWVSKTTVGGGVVCKSMGPGFHPGIQQWSTSLIIGIYPAAGARRHLQMSPSCINNVPVRQCQV